MSTPQLPPGTVVDERFTVGNAVRTREGATVYDATNAQGGPCSLTIYDASCFPSGLVLERSLRELRQLQSVSSARVVSVLAAGKFGDSGVYEATTLLPPQTLTDTIAAGPLPMADAAALIVQVGEALLEAQRVGVIHRNLGGDVIFPSPEGVKVTGFAVGEPQGGGSFGALTSIAPEQVQGKVVDQRTLIYNAAALMHWMLSGAPLFAGERQAVLDQHNGGDPPSVVHAKLKRALGKDPRMRPMMLKQFLGEIAALGGVEPPKPAARVAPTIKPPAAAAPVATPSAGVAPPATKDGRKPSSRGWTMFMKAADDDDGAPASAPAPAAEPKPSTRGWTMFMQEGDEGSTQDAASGAGEPASTPAQPPSDPAEPKPSTRGWTMFMQAQDEGGDNSQAAETPASSSPAPAPTDDEVQPSTRGWTMFMKEGDEAGGGDSSAPAAEQPAAEPTTRGWTMFMNEGEGDGAAQAAAAAPPVTPEPDAPVAPPVASSAASPLPAPPAHGTDAPPPLEGEAAAAGPAPSSRGWTMFMEPGGSPEPGGTVEVPRVADPPDAASGPEPAATAAGLTEMATVEPTPPLDEAGAGEEPATKKRGWTMFMDAPIADLAKASPEAVTKPEPVPEPEPELSKGASDKKGWTVFGEPAPGLPSVPSVEVTGSDAPQRGKTVMITGTPAGQAPGVADLPPPAPPGMEAAPPGEASRVKTVVASGVAAQQGPGGSVTGRTVASAAGGAAGDAPDTRYFKRGQEPEKAGAVSPRAPTVREVEAPAGLQAAASRADDAPRPTTLPPQNAAGNSMVMYIVIGAVAFAAIGAAAFFAFS